MLPLYPMVSSPEQLPMDGILQDLPNHCRKADRSVCSQHYRSISGKPGLHLCPFGYSTYAVRAVSCDYLFTGLHVKGHSNTTAIKRRKPESKPKAIDFDFLNATVSRAVDHYESLITDTQIAPVLHETRILNAQIKSQVEGAIRHLAAPGDSLGYVRYRLDNIFATSSLMSVRLNVFDLTQNPDLARAQRRTVAIYKKFEKVTHCLESLCREKDISIAISGSSFSEIQGYECFDILPFVLIENAIKYSPPGQRIDIVFDDDQDRIKIVVESYGPVVENGEELQIFSRSVRGINAQGGRSGSGLGLYIAKVVCGMHNFEIEACSRGNQTSIGGVPYAIFSVQLRLVK